MTTLPLPTLFSRALATASKAANLPTVDDETQVRFYSGPQIVHSYLTMLQRN